MNPNQWVIVIAESFLGVGFIISLLTNNRDGMLLTGGALAGLVGGHLNGRASVA